MIPSDCVLSEIGVLCFRAKLYLQLTLGSHAHAQMTQWRWPLYGILEQ